MTDKLTPFYQDIMRSANRNGVDTLCNLPDWVIAEIARGIVETIWMYQRGAVTPTQMVRELVGEEAARREAEQPCSTPDECEVGGCLKPSACQAAAVEDKPAPADDDLLAMLEGLAMGLEQQEEKSAAFRVRQAADRIEQADRAIAGLMRSTSGLAAENARLREALAFYAPLLKDCNRISPEGMAARNTLAKDRGDMARAALARGGDHG